MPAIEWIMPTSSASAGSRAGSSPGWRAAGMDFPVPDPAAFGRRLSGLMEKGLAG